jgi:hypothetical protein
MASGAPLVADAGINTPCGAIEASVAEAKRDGAIAMILLLH